MNEPAIRRTAIQVNQRFGRFYIVKFTAAELLTLAYSEPLRVENGRMRGNQRLVNTVRTKAIREYIGSSECAFPGSIILAANFQKTAMGALCNDDAARWIVEKGTGSESHVLVVPKMEPMAVIIDGQHRLEGFRDSGAEARAMDLVCSVYLDLPAPQQAFLFATINSTQKPVSKSLAYELFGFDLTDESPEAWSPDKLAISVCRKLNGDTDGPLFRHIKPGAICDDIVDDTPDVDGEYSWQVSTACVVACILRLISSRPNTDKAKLYEFGAKRRLRTRLKEFRRDTSPLRELYIDGHDSVIYLIISNVFKASTKVYTKHYASRSALSKTIGVQAIFEVLFHYVRVNDKELKEIGFQESVFVDLFSKSQEVDFSDDFFMKFSGVGFGRVRDSILVAAGLKDLEKVRSEESRLWIRKNVLKG
jgi:DNA phosphorothioation-associated DGQHR protein 1